MRDGKQLSQIAHLLLWIGVFTLIPLIYVISGANLGAAIGQAISR